MKITRSTLIDLARREAERRAEHGDVLSGYLIGSVTGEDFLLGGTADVDLVLIHRSAPEKAREMITLSQEIHLDILHHDQALYQQPRELRVHPWLGPSMCEPIFLYDPDHFFEWAQAGARGQFYRPDHVRQRALAFIQRARQARSLLNVTNRWVNLYCRSATAAANAAACLTGFPVAGRRFMLKLQEVLSEMGSTELYGLFLQLIGSDLLSDWNLPSLFGLWGKAFDAASQNSSEPELAVCRRGYFLHGFQALAENDQPRAVTLTLLKSWERSMFFLNSKPENLDHYLAWEGFLRDIQLSPPDYDRRTAQLDDFIDRVETTVDAWAEKTGA